MCSVPYHQGLLKRCRCIPCAYLSLARAFASILCGLRSSGIKYIATLRCCVCQRWHTPLIRGISKLVCLRKWLLG